MDSLYSLLGDKKFGLRNIPGLKQFLITLVWTMSTVLLPLLEAQHHHMGIVNMRDATILVAKRFLFIGALTVPFDIRDLFQDRQTGLKNHPRNVRRKKCLPIFARCCLQAILFCYSCSGITVLVTTFFGPHHYRRC